MLKKYFLLGLFFFACGAANCTELQTEESKLLMQELRSNINSTLSEVMLLEKSAGNELLDIVLAEKGRSTNELGLIRDPASGLVLSVSPNSNAKMLGIQTGDKLVSLSSSDESLNLDRKLSFRAGDLISAKVLRDGSEMILQGEALSSLGLAWSLNAVGIVDNNVTAAEALEGCGRISVFFTPPEAKELYPAYVNKIDNKSVLRTRETFKRASGKHTVYIHELIPAREIGRHSNGLQRAKPLEITIEPNKTYYIAAKFHRSKRFNQRKAEYWEPIVWKVSDVSCEL